MTLTLLLTFGAPLVAQQGQVTSVAGQSPLQTIKTLNSVSRMRNRPAVAVGPPLSVTSGAVVTGTAVYLFSFLPTAPPGLVVEMSDTGTILSGGSGYVGGSILGPVQIAIDGSGNAWILNGGSKDVYGPSVTELIGVAVPVVTPLALGVLGTRP